MKIYTKTGDKGMTSLIGGKRVPKNSARLESYGTIDRMDAEVPPMKYFVLPGGNQCVSFCHMARTICRRAERRILDLAAETEVDGSVMKYVNRLSDYLFILARKIAYDSGCEEMKWVPRK